MNHRTYWQTIWTGLKSRPLGMLGLVLLALFVFIALYAPFLASSKPIVVVYDGKIYFPLFRYLCSSSFFSKKIDLFFNILGLFFPLLVLTKAKVRAFFACLFIIVFAICGFFTVLDPASSPYLNAQKEALILQLQAKREKQLPSWNIDLEHMNAYAKLNLVLSEYHKRRDHSPIATEELKREKEAKDLLEAKIRQGKAQYEEALKEEEGLKNSGATGRVQQRILQLEEENGAYEELENRLEYIQDRRFWLDSQQSRITFIIMPLLRNHHWEDDVGGDEALNLRLPLWEESRINGKDLMAGLIFGCRISLFVGFAATLLAVGIGVPLGLISGYYGGAIDITLSRLVEIWEAMPVFFMLLLIVTMLQTKSIFVVIFVIAFFSWMSAFRFVRAETFRQREMLYVDATKALGFPDSFILYRHILPNSILAVLALLPFDIMAAITSESALAFLGLGEEQSCSWGVLMDEGRTVFPADSSLLWPPAIALTVLLIAVAFVGEALHGAMDPKSEQ